MSEFSPPWSSARMTKWQVKKYVKDMKKAQALAQAKLDEARANWEFEKEENELNELEKKLDEII